jgi:hypothetical protein
MFRKFAWFAQVLLALLWVPAVHAQGYGYGYYRPVGTVALTDNYYSSFALYRNGTWAGLPNWRVSNGGPSFMAYSLSPPINYSAGYWSYDRRVPAVNMYGSNGVPLATFNGLRPRYYPAQWGNTSGWRAGPAPQWSYMR